jgi:hypothetical protein
MKVKSAIIKKKQKSYYLLPLSPETNRTITGFIHQKIGLFTISVNKAILSTKIGCLRSY